MPNGKLLLTVRAAEQALPAEQCLFRITDIFGAVVFEDVLTRSSSGISKTVEIQTPPGSLSLDRDNREQPYALLNAFIRGENSYRMQFNGLQLFEGMLATLPVDLIPLPDDVPSPESAPEIVINIPRHILFDPQKASEPTSVQSSAFAVAEANTDSAVTATRPVYIPQSITVHLGTPDSDAQNVTVSFLDYIKNVACSEIYPTWPYESLKANIIAQISIALNRVYTEWYRSRGYDFDITSSTTVDQAFVYGRNIFSQISDIVDEIFNNYITRPFSVEPLFAQYCNGTTSTCPGLSQWGTVSLANNGLTFDDILAFYYGDIKLNETDDIRAITESYPGTPLSAGSEGRDVLVIQEQLNRIAINYPEIPLNSVTTRYDAQTVAAVTEFQRLFVLPQTGIVDKSTWYRIAYIYASVKRLAQITSEGQRASYRDQVYPGVPVKLNSKGSEVQEIQFYLTRISVFNPAVLPAAIDGIYGKATQSSVLSFQRTYGIPQTGTVDEQTWNRLVAVYNGTVDNVQKPTPPIDTLPYPEAVLSKPSQGPSVSYIQSRLNSINNIFVMIPELVEDGIFGTKTESAVNTFALLFGFEQNGAVDRALWDKINEIYVSVESLCIFATSQGNGTNPYPKTVFSTGSRGESVRYIQSKLNTLHTAVSYVTSLEEDGIFGAKTEKSVSEAQRTFGLTATGAVDEPTWLLLNYLYLAITSGCLKADARSALLIKRDENHKMSDSEAKELLADCGLPVSKGIGGRRRTQTALMVWQAVHGLPVSGVLDGLTVKAMLLAREQKER